MSIHTVCLNLCAHNIKPHCVSDCLSKQCAVCLSIQIVWIVVHYYSGTVLQWYSDTVVLKGLCYNSRGLKCYTGTVLQWYSGTVLQGYYVTVVLCYCCSGRILLLLYYCGTILLCYWITMLLHILLGCCNIILLCYCVAVTLYFNVTVQN